MRKRLELYSRFLQISSSVTEEDESNVSSHFLTMNTENDSQILQLSKRRADVLVQEIRSDAQTACNSDFASY